MSALKTSTNAIKLGHRRVDQLKLIGSKLNLSIAETVGYMIKKEIDAGTIAAGVPGVLVEKARDGVTVAIDDGTPVTMGRSDALGLVNSIRDAVSGGRLTSPDSLGMGDKTWLYAVLRRGSGIKIIVPFPGADNSFSPDVAADIADLIEKAAA